MRFLLPAPALCFLAPLLIYAAAEPNPEIVSPLTLVVEQEQIENTKAALNGKVERVLWQQVRIEHTPSGDSREILQRSVLTRYDANNRPIEVTDHEGGETRSTNTYEKGLLISTRGRTFNAEGKQIGEEFWQIYQYGAAGQLLDFKRGRGEKLENHFVSEYDASGRLTRRDVRGAMDALVYTEQYLYSGKPTIVQHRILAPGALPRDSARFLLDETGSVTELWNTGDGYHVRFKYDSQQRVIEQLTDPYNSPCDECPVPGAIRTHYDDRTREQTFLDGGGKAVLQRIVALEKDGSIASIRYLRSNGTSSQEASDLNRIADAISPQGGKRFINTTSDDHENWTEKKVIFQPTVGASITQFIYRRIITYR